jgi:peptide/nickel transport system substrate-binding protein
MESNKCPHCNFDNPAAAKFCSNCGEPFLAAPTASSEHPTRKEESESASTAQGKQPDWLAQLYRDVDDAKKPKAEPVAKQKRSESVPPAHVPPPPPAAGAPPVSLPAAQPAPAISPAVKAARKAPVAPELATMEAALKAAPEAPKKASGRGFSLGCIVLVGLFCLGGIATAITGVVFQEQIKELLGLDRTPPVAAIAPTAEPTEARATSLPARPTSTYAPTETQEPSPTPTITATATPAPPRTLTICIASEPNNFYLYGEDNLAKQHVLQAVYDGPIDLYEYDYHATVLEKLPSLADGDAVILRTTVSAGDTVVNNADSVVTLANGEMVRPAGCRSADCAIPYNGGSLQMDVMQVTFSLLPGLTWSDGTPLTASDSVYSFTVEGDPDTDTDQYLYHRTADYRAVDDLTAIWIGMPGYLDQNYYTNFWSPLPEHVLGRYSATSLPHADLDELLLGWGPYVFDHYAAGAQISFTRNANYFRAAEGLPVFSDLVIRFIGTESSTAISMLLAGECDLLDREIYLMDQGEALLDWDESGSLDVVVWNNQVWEHADLNILPSADIVNTGAFSGWDQDRDGEGPFGDARLRRAVAYCLDRQAVVDSVYFGANTVLNGILPPDHPLLAPNLPSFTYNPQAGMALLDEIGWIDADGNPSTPRLAQAVTGVPNGTPLTFFYETTNATQRVQAVQILAESLSECGFGVTVNHLPSSEWFAVSPDSRLWGRRFDLGQFAWMITFGTGCELYLSDNIPGDPEVNDQNGEPIFPEGWDGQNDSGYRNPRYDDACSQALETLPGEPGYVENSWDLQYILVEDLPIIPLYTRININATRPDFCNFVTASAQNSELWNLEAFDYGDTCP